MLIKALETFTIKGQRFIKNEIFDISDKLTNDLINAKLAELSISTKAIDDLENKAIEADDLEDKKIKRRGKNA